MEKTISVWDTIVLQPQLHYLLVCKMEVYDLQECHIIYLANNQPILKLQCQVFGAEQL